LVSAKIAWCKKSVCVEDSLSKTLEVEQKGIKLVDASGMAVRVCAEKAVSAEEGQNLQVRMESAGRKSCMLARTSVEEKTSGI
jgi:hypothetical protein